MLSDSNDSGIRIRLSTGPITAQSRFHAAGVGLRLLHSEWRIARAAVLPLAPLRVPAELALGLAAALPAGAGVREPECTGFPSGFWFVRFLSWHETFSYFFRASSAPKVRKFLAGSSR